MDKREKVPKSPNKTIKVTETNRKRLNRLVGRLMDDGEEHSCNDAINYLFDYLFECNTQIEQIKQKEKIGEG